MKTLRCFSFHSVKGGVGKSTLALLAARYLAEQNPAERTLLIDMDLTGTSLADVVSVCAPTWGQEREEIIDLRRAPSGFLSRAESVRRIEDRADSIVVRPGTAAGVTFLNDFLLFATEDWNAEEDVHIDAVTWSLEGSRLLMIPSSALPNDVQQAVPVIFDEEHSAFIEARLETLLDLSLATNDLVNVVIDVPPTIPGLSRAVLSLATRIGKSEKAELSEDGGMPTRLHDAAVEWKSFVVTTYDVQDLRAASRWLTLVTPGEQDIFRAVINRVPGDPGDAKRWISNEVLHDLGNAILDEAEIISEGAAYRVFGRNSPTGIPDEIARLLRS